MFNWLSCLFGKEEPYSGGSHEALIAFINSTKKEMDSLARGKDLEAELIREIDKLSADLVNVRRLLRRIRRERENNGNSIENSN